jgi:hypothetical protein
MACLRGHAIEAVPTKACRPKRVWIQSVTLDHGPNGRIRDDDGGPRVTGAGRLIRASTVAPKNAGRGSPRELLVGGRVPSPRV